MELFYAYKDYEDEVLENEDYFRDYINWYFLPEVQSELWIIEEDWENAWEWAWCELPSENFENYSEEYLNYLKENYPEFQYLMNEYPDRMKEWENRMILFKELNDYKKHDIPVSALEEVKNALYRETDKEFFQDAEIESLVTRWPSAPTTWGWDSYLRILSQVSNDTSIVMETFGEVDTEAIQDKTIDEEWNLTEQGEQMERLEIFLSALESKYDDKEFKSELIDIYEKLNKWNLDAAKDQTNTLIDTIGASWRSVSSWLTTNFDEESFTAEDLVQNDVSLMKALREIWARQQASKLSVENMQIWENDEWEMEVWIDTDMEWVEEEKISKLEDFMNEEVSIMNRHWSWAEVTTTSRIDEARENAESDVDKMLDTLMESMEWHPNYFQYEQQKDQIRQGLIEMKATKEVLNDFIEKNGDDWLGEMMDIYNDMMGIDWWLFDNWSDASFDRLRGLWQFVLETIIIAALTFGTGLLIQAARAGGRAVVAWTRAASSARSSRIADAANLRVTKSYNLEKAANTSKRAFTWNMDIPRVWSSVNVTWKSTRDTYSILNDWSSLLVTNVTRGWERLDWAATLQILKTHFRWVNIAEDIARNPQQLKTHLTTTWSALSRWAWALIVVNAGKYFLASEWDNWEIDLSEIDINEPEVCEPDPDPEPEPEPDPEPEPEPGNKNEPSIELPGKGDIDKYEVKSWDTLWEIVKDHYDLDNNEEIENHVNAVVAYNNGHEQDLSDKFYDERWWAVKWNYIYPWDIIKLPSSDWIENPREQ